MTKRIEFLDKRINEEIVKVMKNEQPRSLFDPAIYTLSMGGKRIRPLLTLMAVDLFGKDIEDAINPAMAIEIFHNFTLLHDDLMDNADIRRGNPTVHKRWDSNTAILSGDAMVVESYKYISRVSSDLLPKILTEFSNTAMDICRGQQFDMDFEKRNDVTEAEYIDMIRLKTAVLLGCSLKLGALISKAPLAEVDALYDYGINIGLAFQLKDDLLDVYGDPKTFGKNIGGDILCNKKTYLLIKALEKSNTKQRNELEKWLTAEQYNPQEKIEAVKNIYDELNLKVISEKLIENYYLASLDCLSSINVTDIRKKDLIQLSENLMYREK